MESRIVSQKRLEDFGGYRKAGELFDLVAMDMETLEKRPLCWRLVGQQIASADSIAANIEEGWGRGSRREYVLFLSYARGSARETRGRYQRLRRWLIAHGFSGNGNPPALDEAIRLDLAAHYAELTGFVTGRPFAPVVGDATARITQLVRALRP